VCGEHGPEFFTLNNKPIVVYLDLHLIGVYFYVRQFGIGNNLVPWQLERLELHLIDHGGHVADGSNL
jgi:hypothetical protein